MAKKIFGTPAITGLNIKRGSHLIEDNELVESVNGWTDEDGVWSVARRPERLYSGSDIVAYEAGRMGGADHHVYLDGSTLYDNGVSVGTINGVGSNMSIKAIDDQFIISGATKPHIYDGDGIREQGGWQPELSYTFGLTQRSPATNYVITAATKASQCVLDVSSTAFGVGDTVHIENVPGMTELNGNNYEVVAKTVNDITIDVDSSGFGTFTALGDGRIMNRHSAVVETVVIKGATNAGSCELTVDSHTMSVGEVVWIDGCVSMPELNRPYLGYSSGGAIDTYTGGTVPEPWVITAQDATHITINAASTNWSIWTAFSGLAYLNGCGIEGNYKFYIVGTVELSDGTILTGKPVPIGDRSIVSSQGFDEDNPTEYSVLPIDSLEIEGVVYLQEVGGSSLYDHSGTIGVDYFPGLRLYRTKDDGYDVYLQKSWRHGDADFVYTAGASVFYTITPRYGVRSNDDELGAVLPYGFNDHTSAPAHELATFAGQRTFVAVGKYLHWSSFDGMEYYSDAGNVLMWDTITALGSYRDYCIVFSADRMWAVRMINGVPDIEEIDTPVGTTYPLAVEQTSMGLMFLREDGLWLFAGGTVEKISRRAFKDLVSPKSVSMAGDVLYVSGSEQAFVAINRGDSWIWHESSYYLPYASSTSGKLYAASTYSVDQLFLGARSSGSFKTKSFGSMDLSMGYKLEMDIEGESIPSVAVNGNVVSDTAWHLDDTPLFPTTGMRFDG